LWANFLDQMSFDRKNQVVFVDAHIGILCEGILLGRGSQ
jgi:hypothetical protein